MIGAQRGIQPWMAFARPTAFAQFGFIGFAFLALVASFVRSDFSVAAVYHHSHSQQPLIYKIAATWGNHEPSGTILVWRVPVDQDQPVDAPAPAGFAAVGRVLDPA